MRRILSLCLLLLIGQTALPAPAAGQDPAADVRLEEFVEGVARLWAAADVSALVGLVPADDRLILDTGNGTETANSRHAAAALRALFSGVETMYARPVRVTLASATPARGFGELFWTYRTRGAPGEQSRSVYVAALYENGAWRVAELRVMP
ncbi:MAG: hypothetical protein WD766_04125 [Gemmatimonadota bacterium]